MKKTAKTEIPEKRGRGRPRLDPSGLADAEQVRLPMPAGGKDRIKMALRDGESVTGFIRSAIEREIARRAKGVG
jgi:hypothetical protein